ncbi:hypothetical protein [Sphingobacterium kitahiroshimense]|uniref:hypothetical protein n=1 Tax=Sphingobacterium kitahiroshimense TaxID=470446 RepID=UPI00320B4151
MQKTCYREGYALSPGKELSSFLSENVVDVIKKRTMITFLTERFFKKPEIDSVDGSTQMGMRYVMRERPAERLEVLPLSGDRFKK